MLFATGQVSVGTSATLLVAARAGRKYVILNPDSSVKIGPTNALTSANGAPTSYLIDGKLETEGDVYAIRTSTGTVTYIEVY